MLRVVAHKSAAAARQYDTEGLKREDYYLDGQEVAGKWHGISAKLLGIEGDVTKEAFAALVDNKHPSTGKRLTPRTNADRTVGYDFNFHAPKSLSLVHALTGDKEIVRAFREAVAETMAEIETRISTRVRKKGAQENRITGNFAWAEFIHFTSRPVGGIPDPHLHVHAWVPNLSFDFVEDRWKAAQFREVKAEAPMSQASFHSRLSSKIAGLGYGIARTPVGWEIEGISRETIEKFSRRTAQIEGLAAKKGIKDPDKKAELGASSRERKKKGTGYSDLKKEWRERLSGEEKADLLRARFANGKNPGKRVTAKEALDYACEKLFEKHSVVEQRKLTAEAMRFGVGHLTPSAIEKEFSRRGMIVREVNGQTLCTTVDILSEEVGFINFVRRGRGAFAPLNGKPEKLPANFTNEERAAYEHALKSKDQFIAIRGGAGVGKTTLMQQIVPAIQQQGLKVFAFAPSAAASRDTMRSAGFTGADTVAQLLSNPKMQLETRGQVIWIDEAGLLGIRDMWRLMGILGESTKVIVTGDHRQHPPVARGNPFKLMQDYSGLKVAEVTQIRRQQREDYKEAVSALSKGDLAKGFRCLDEMGAIAEIQSGRERYETLAKDYVTLTGKGETPLVVSPTHSENALVTEAIRDAKKEIGGLQKERVLSRYHNLRWQEADRKRTENYRKGLIVQFHQNARGITRGELFHVVGHDKDGGVRLKGAAGREIILPEKLANRFEVFEERPIAVAKGERIRITRNGDSKDGRRINNGNVFTVEKFAKNGDIVLTTGAVLCRDHGHFTHGYCQTSYSSQSTSVGHVLVAQSADSFVASSREQFYVSASRGKETIRIYTDDRAGLQEAVGNSSVKRSAIEFAGIRSKDISEKMSELTGKQWRDLIRSRTTEDNSNTHEQNLMRQRRQNVAPKDKAQSWENFIKMKRAISGADGMSRARVGSGTQKQKRQNTQNRGRAGIRGTTLREPIVKRAVTPTRSVRETRLAKAFRTAAKNFKKVAKRAKMKVAAKVKDARKTLLGASKNKTNARHAIKQRAVDASKRAKTRAMQQQRQKQQAKDKQISKQKTIKPQAPTPKRGR